MRICILGWGSLIWDVRPEFDAHHRKWQFDGPTLKLEFSRVSESRHGALTLVIDPAHGARCRIAYAESTRKNPDDAICDLRSREGTVLRHIGAMFLDGSRLQGGSEDTLNAIRIWGQEKKFDVVVWTNLPANFQEKTGMPFSVDAACTCCIPCDYVPVRSWPLFRARELMHQLIESFVPLGKEQVSAP